MSDRKPIDENVRARIRKDFKSSFLVEASAGTGKTTCMVERITGALVEELASPDEIAAITFTNKAADELKSRVMTELFKLQSRAKGREKDKIANIVEKIGGCEISTIHSFYHRLLSERPLEADLDARVELMDESEETPDNIWRYYMEEKITDFKRYEDLLYSLEVFSVSMDYFKNFCFKSADYPELELGYVPEIDSVGELKKICFRMFERFAGRVTESLRKCNNPIEDEYCRQVRYIKKSWEKMKDSSDREKMAFISALKKVKKVKKGDKKNWDKDGRNIGIMESENANEILSEINGVISDFLFRVAVDLYRDFESFYDEYKKKNSVITFVDSLVKIKDTLRNNKNVRGYFRKKYKMVLVDEFQDTDPIQAEVVAILCSDDASVDDWRKLNIVPGKLFVVGDPKQSIYRFRRADITVYEEFKELFKGRGRDVLKLKQNFRSLEGVTSAVNKYFSQRIRKTDNMSSPGYDPIESFRGPGGGVTLLEMKLTGDGDPEEVLKKDSDKLLARYLASREQKTFAGWLSESLDSGSLKVRDKRTGIERTAHPGEIIILFKRSTHIGGWEEALQERGIPVENVSGKDFFSREEIKEASAIVTAAASPSDTASVYGALKSSVFGLTDTEIYEIVRETGGLNYSKTENFSSLPDKSRRALEKLEKLSRIGLSVPQSVAARFIIEESGLIHLYSGVLGKHSSAASLYKFSSMMENMMREKSLDLYAAVEELANMREDGERPLFFEQEKPAGVRLMTIHQAKGLEAPVVVLGDMSAKNFRKSYINTCTDRSRGKYFRTFVANRTESYEWSKDFESKPKNWDELHEKEIDFLRQEEKRLEYVLFTRASDRFIVTDSKSRGKSFSSDLIRELKKDENTEIEKIEYSNYLKIPELKKERKPYDRGFELYKNEFKENVKKSNSPLYEKRNPSRLDDDAYSSEEGYGKKHGDTVHRLIRSVFKFPEKKIEYDKYENPDAVKKHLENAIRSDVFSRAQKAREKYTEFNLSYYDKAKADLTRGSIDLLFKEPGGWVIVDYKTNMIHNRENINRLTGHYQIQLKRYRRVFEEVTGEKVKETLLLFLDREDMCPDPVELT